MFVSRLHSNCSTKVLIRTYLDPNNLAIADNLAVVSKVKLSITNCSLRGEHINLCVCLSSARGQQSSVICFTVSARPQVQMGRFLLVEVVK